MTEQLIQRLKELGLEAKLCAVDSFLSIKAYKAADPHERIRIGADGATYTQADGWMWQLMHVEDTRELVKTMIKEKENG